MPQHHDLTGRLLRGDREAFDALFEHLYGPIAAFVIGRTRSREKARRIIEAVFVELLEELPRSAGVMSIEALAFTIARRRGGTAAHPQPRSVRREESERLAQRS